MAFPTVQATATTSGESATATSHTVNLPSGITAGDLLLIIFGSRDAPGTISATGWTWLATDTTSSISNIALGYRVADGSEGSTVTVSTTNSRKTAAIAYRISGADTSQAPVKATAATGSGGTFINPPNNSPGFSGDILWIAAYDQSTTTSQAGAPTNYSNLLNAISSGGTAGTNAAVASAERQLNASSEDPGAFTTIAGGNAWVAQTFAIKPASAPTSRYRLPAMSGGFDNLANMQG